MSERESDGGKTLAIVILLIVLILGVGYFSGMFGGVTPGTDDTNTINVEIPDLGTDGGSATTE